MIPFNNFQVRQNVLNWSFTLKIEYFQAYYRGSIVEDAPPLDLEKIGTFGLQTFGGVYDEFKQSGVGSLEIDLIALYWYMLCTFLNKTNTLHYSCFIMLKFIISAIIAIIIMFQQMQ